mmetsp:Transcript_49461/g.92590  ORF Transcript_49461/g.92590 Transcript_49461/m.92590 type:complete len:635 (-) Transcript_49461:26-1930(-)
MSAPMPVHSVSQIPVAWQTPVRVVPRTTSVDPFDTPKMRMETPRRLDGLATTPAQGVACLGTANKYASVVYVAPTVDTPETTSSVGSATISTISMPPTPPDSSPDAKRSTLLIPNSLPGSVRPPLSPAGSSNSQGFAFYPTESISGSKHSLLVSTTASATSLSIPSYAPSSIQTQVSRQQSKEATLQTPRQSSRSYQPVCAQPAKATVQTSKAADYVRRMQSAPVQFSIPESPDVAVIYGSDQSKVSLAQVDGQSRRSSLITIQSQQELQQISVVNLSDDKTAAYGREEIYTPASKRGSNRHAEKLQLGSSERTRSAGARSKSQGSKERRVSKERRPSEGRNRSLSKERRRSVSKERRSSKELPPGSPELEIRSPRDVLGLRVEKVLGDMPQQRDCVNEWMASMREPTSARGEGCAPRNTDIESKILEDMEYQLATLRREAAQSLAEPAPAARPASHSPQRARKTFFQEVKRSQSTGRRDVRAAKEGEQTRSELFGLVPQLMPSPVGDTGARFRHVQEFVDANGNCAMFLKDDAKRQNLKDISQSPKQSVRHGFPYITEATTPGGRSHVTVRAFDRIASEKVITAVRSSFPQATPVKQRPSPSTPRLGLRATHPSRPCSTPRMKSRVIVGETWA